LNLGVERVLPGVWRWAAADRSEGDRCGTALKTPDGLVLVDPPGLARDERVFLEGAGGEVRFVVLTTGELEGLAAPFEGAELRVAGRDALPGGLLPVALPLEGEAAVLWPEAGDGLLMVGDVLPFVGPTPVYLEGEAPEMAVFLDCIRALLAADPRVIAPAHQALGDRAVMRSTAWAAHIGNQLHQRRAAPVEGPRFLVPMAERVLDEALIAPVVLRRDAEGRWKPDPFACARCGAPNVPMTQTCGGPPIARLCPECRKEQRDRLPLARLMVCAGGCCTREGARAVASAARRALVERGLEQDVDVVPVSCLGECSLGPFVRVSTARNEEPEVVRTFRERTVERARVYARQEGEVIDDESELVLSRFAAQVQPREVERLVEEVAAELVD
jgi:(2Fe-2S) ferredoxin